MTMPLVDVTVRSNWQEIGLELAVRRRRQWRAAEVAIAAATLAMLAGTQLFPEWPWHGMFRVVVFIGVLWLLPLWSIMRERTGITSIVSRLGAASLLLLVASAIAFITAPRGAEEQAWTSTLPILVVPGLTWSLLVLLQRRYPISTRILGVTGDRWPVNLVIGIAAGLVLGLHLVLTTFAYPGLRVQPPPGLAVLTWALCFRAGLTALGEELFFRGLGYQLLTNGSSRSVAIATAKLTVLNLPIYLIPIVGAQPQTLVTVVLILVYGAAFSVVATFLRHRQHSLLPGLACNVVFSLFLIAFLKL